MFQNGFVAFDDDIHIASNDHVRQGLTRPTELRQPGDNGNPLQAHTYYQKGLASKNLDLYSI